MAFFGYSASEVVRFGDSYATLCLVAKNFFDEDDKVRHEGKTTTDELVSLARIAESYLKSYKEVVPQDIRGRFERVSPINLRRLEARLAQLFL